MTTAAYYVLGSGKDNILLSKPFVLSRNFMKNCLGDITTLALVAFHYSKFSMGRKSMPRVRVDGPGKIEY